VLATFIQEGTEMPAVDSLKVPAPCIEALWAIHRIGQECQTLERAANAAPPPKGNYWDLNTFWVEPVWRWLQGATPQEPSADYEFYEGNLLRTLMKLVNILEEWRSLASLQGDVNMLDRMRGYEDRLLSGIAVCDSLYLRI
jgi:superfamily II RNA helicase